MNRRVLAIPIEEVAEQFKTNARQDIKLVAPQILTQQLYEFLVAKGKNPEKEEPLQGARWHHSPEGSPNQICESKDFIHKSIPQYADGPFCFAFANEKAAQDQHYHSCHLELYYSESPMIARYRLLEGKREEDPIDLPRGGLIVFGPDVVHTVSLKGLTIVLEFPAVANDKKDAKL